MELAEVIKSIIFFKENCLPWNREDITSEIDTGYCTESRPQGRPGTMTIHQTNSPLLRIVLTEDAEGLLAGIQAILAQGLI